MPIHIQRRPAGRDNTARRHGRRAFRRVGGGAPVWHRLRVVHSHGTPLARHIRHPLANGHVRRAEIHGPLVQPGVRVPCDGPARRARHVRPAADQHRIVRVLRDCVQV